MDRAQTVVPCLFSAVPPRSPAERFVLYYAFCGSHRLRAGTPYLLLKDTYLNPKGVNKHQPNDLVALNGKYSL